MSRVDGEALLRSLGDRLSGVRGRLTPDADMSKITWFRAGGPAELLFQPADEEDLSRFLRALPEEVPVLPVGIGSNLLVRDGGVPGVVVRLSAKGFGEAEQVSRYAPSGRRGLSRQASRRCRACSRHRRLPLLSRHSRGGRRRGPDERRRQRCRDARAGRRGLRASTGRETGMCCRTPTWATATGTPRAPDDLIFTGAALRGPRGGGRRDPGGDGRRADAPRDRAADPREDRRLDIQEPAGHLGLEGNRRGRLPRADDRRRADVADALQLHDQHGRGRRLRP